MTNTEIMKMELNFDLSMIKEWSERMHSAENKSEAEMYRSCLRRSTHKAEAKEELIQSLGYTILFTEDRTECISIYPMELDD